jgi:hypothetical protein
MSGDYTSFPLGACMAVADSYFTLLYKTADKSVENVAEFIYVERQ